MSTKEEYLNSLPTERIKQLRDEWQEIWLQRPHYWIAEVEYKMLNRIVALRQQKQT